MMWSGYSPGVLNLFYLFFIRFKCSKYFTDLVLNVPKLIKFLNTYKRLFLRLLCDTDWIVFTGPIGGGTWNISTVVENNNCYKMFIWLSILYYQWPLIGITLEPIYWSCVKHNCRIRTYFWIYLLNSQYYYKNLWLNLRAPENRLIVFLIKYASFISNADRVNCIDFILTVSIKNKYQQ